MANKLLLSFNFPNQESIHWASKIHHCALKANWKVLLCDLSGDQLFPFEEIRRRGISYMVLNDCGLETSQRLTRAQYIELCRDDLDFARVSIHDVYCEGLPIDEKYLNPESVWRQRLQGTAFRIEELLEVVKPQVVLSPQGANAISKIILAKCQKLSIPVAIRESPFFPEYCLLDTQGMHFYPQQSEIVQFAPAFMHEELNGEQEGYVNKFIADWKDRRQSKYSQPHEHSLLQIQNLKAAGTKVLFLPGQLGKDASVVYGLHCFDSLDDFQQSIAKYLPEGWVLMTKKHPYADPQDTPKLPQAINVDHANLHDLIEISDAVAVFSSNVGLESLLYGKPVICGGLPHYGRKGFTLDLEDREQIHSLIGASTSFQPDQEKLRRYLYYLLTDYLFKEDDTRGFLCKMQRIMDRPLQTDARAPLSSELNSKMIEYLRFADRYAHWADENLVHEEIVDRALQDFTFNGQVQQSVKGSVLESGERQLGISFADIDPGHVARYDFASKLLINPTRILDVACGIGYGSALLNMQHGVEVIGVDASSAAIEYGREYWSNPAVQFHRSSCGRLFDECTQNFDAIISLETIEHLINPAKFLDSCWQHLNEQGLLIISVPNSAVFPLFYTKYHIQHFCAEELQMILGRLNPSLIRVFGQSGTQISSHTNRAKFLLAIAGKKVDESAVDHRLAEILPYSLQPVRERSVFELPAKLFTCPGGILTSEGWEIPAELAAGFAFYGPYSRFPAGHYEVEFHFGDQMFPGESVRFDVAYANGQILVSCSGNRETNRLIFDHQSAEKQLEFRAIIESPGSHAAVFQGVSLKRLES